MQLKNLIQEGAKGFIGAVTEHHSGIFTVTTIAAIGAFGVEVWIQKDAIMKAYEETKGQPFMAKVKAMWKPVAKCAVPFGIAISSQLANNVMSVKQLKEATNKLQDMTALANTTAIAANAYEEATKETVGEEKAKEIQAKAAEKEQSKVPAPSIKMQQPTCGYYDIYYAGILPGCEFMFNPDKEVDLERYINKGNDEYGDNARNSISKYVLTKGKLRDDQFTVAELLDAIEDIGPEGTVIKRPNWEYDWGWDDDEHIAISSNVSTSVNGRPCRELVLSPKPHYLYDSMWKDK